VNRAAGAAREHSTNLVGVAASVLAGTGFNAQPLPLQVVGTRQAHADLFAALDRSARPGEARQVFGHYMNRSFGPVRLEAGLGRASYLKLLQGWGLDANGPAGAVLKGWVESRFGLVPVFHKAPLTSFTSPAWAAYEQEKAASRHYNNGIFQQLDLLFEFSQWMLARFQALGAGPHVTLWRGSTRCEEQLVAGSLRERRCTLRLNNLVSFSRTREQADCFGDWVLQAEVPLAKLLLWPGLLDTSSLHGEAEVLALGGDYEVLARYD
jgi:NAD+--dinitrogen-reductase ADP-D-ribosyltransferase